jgi:hypothetical protein
VLTTSTHALLAALELLVRQTSTQSLLAAL